MEPPEMVELPRVVVQGHPLVHGFHCPYLTKLWNSSMSCSGITKGLRLRSCRVCKISNINPMRVCQKPMHECLGWSWWHKVSQKPKQSSFGMGSWTRSLNLKCKMPFYYNLLNPLWLVCFDYQKVLRWTWWRNEWSPLGSIRKTQKNSPAPSCQQLRNQPTKLHYPRPRGTKLDLDGGSTSYFVEQGGEDKCWRCGGLHKKKDYPNPPQATTSNPNPS